MKNEGVRNDLFKKLNISKDDQKLIDYHLDVLVELSERISHELNAIINLKVTYKKKEKSFKKAHSDFYTRIISNTLFYIMNRVMSKTEKYFDVITMFFTIPAIYNEFRNLFMKGKMTDKEITHLDFAISDIMKNVDEYINNPEEYKQKDIELKEVKK